MSFLKPLLGGPLAGAAGGAITPVSGLGMAGGPLSGLGALKTLLGGGGEGAAPTPKPNAAATGLGKLLGVDGAKISSIANSVGKGMNQIAEAGGANAAYQAPELPAVSANNYLQSLDPAVLRALLQQFGGAR